MMNRLLRSGLAIALGAGLLSAPAISAQEPETAQTVGADEKRSLVFWLIDTCRADHLSVYGHDRKTTPFLERLAKEGVAFDRCYSQAPWTKPSMSSIMTSLYPSRHGSTQMFEPLADSFTTMPEVLRQKGYYTAGFSANPVMGSFTNLSQGFHEFKDSWTMIGGGDVMEYASGSAATIVEHGLVWLEENDKWPFLLYMHSMDPHERYGPEPEYLERFADPALQASFRKDWDALMDQHEDIVNTCTRRTFEAAGVEIEPFIDYANRLYDADILANDTAIEWLWEQLSRDDFIVVVTGDHGVEFFDHGATSLGHSLYDEMIHVPLVMWAPGLLPEGLRFEEPVRSIDIFPTLLDLMGEEIPAGLSGQSLVPWIEAKRATESRVVFADNIEERSVADFGGEPSPELSNGESFTVIRWPWKLILHQKPRLAMEIPRHELFHLKDDPLEKRNLAGQQPDKVAELEAMIVAHVEEGGAVEPPVAPTLKAEDIDPATLDALRALGYVGED